MVQGAGRGAPRGGRGSPVPLPGDPFAPRDPRDPRDRGKPGPALPPPSPRLGSPRRLLLPVAPQQNGPRKRQPRQPQRPPAPHPGSEGRGRGGEGGAVGGAWAARQGRGRGLLTARARAGPTSLWSPPPGPSRPGVRQDAEGVSPLIPKNYLLAPALCSQADRWPPGRAGPWYCRCPARPEAAALRGAPLRT